MFCKKDSNKVVLIPVTKAEFIKTIIHLPYKKEITVTNRKTK